MNPVGYEVIDPLYYERYGYPHAAWAYLRQHAPVAWFEPPGMRPFWAITKYADLSAIRNFAAGIDCFLFRGPCETLVRRTRPSDDARRFGTVHARLVRRVGALDEVPTADALVLALGTTRSGRHPAPLHAGHLPRPV